MLLIWIQLTSFYLIQLAMSSKLIFWITAASCLFWRHCYEFAVKEAWGHLLVDLKQKTSDCLRYCSNISDPGPTVFYIPTAEIYSEKKVNEI